MTGIVKYRAGNMASVSNALARLQTEYIITDEISTLEQCDAIIFPGVGHAAAAMDDLKAKGLEIWLRQTNKPLLGICLGMQLLYEETEEGNCRTLGILPGRLRRFQSRDFNKDANREPEAPLDESGNHAKPVAVERDREADPSAGSINRESDSEAGSADSSVEGSTESSNDGSADSPAEGSTDGSNDGSAERFSAIGGSRYKVPHMGWNRFSSMTNHPVTEQLHPESCFYYVHSYYAPVSKFTTASCNYIEEFSAVVARDNYVGVQFHPEKSGRTGEQLLKNFLTFANRTDK